MSYSALLDSTTWRRPTARQSRGRLPSFLPVSLEQAKDCLGFMAGDRDREISESLQSITNLVEERLAVLLRVPTTTVLATYPTWVRGPYRFDVQPVQSITSFKYYPFQEDTLTTIDPSNYYFAPGSAGRSELWLNSNYTRPGVAERIDAVQVEFEAGYDDAADIPAGFRQLILAELTLAFSDDDRQVASAQRYADRLYSTLSWGNYE